MKGQTQNQIEDQIWGQICRKVKGGLEVDNSTHDTSDA